MIKKRGALMGKSRQMFGSFWGRWAVIAVGLGLLLVFGQFELGQAAEHNAVVVVSVRTANRILPLTTSTVYLTGSGGWSGERTTDGNGFTGFGVIPPETYEVRITAPGFPETRFPGVTFPPGGAVGVGVLLRGSDAPSYWTELYSTYEACKNANPTWNCDETQARGQLEYYRSKLEDQGSAGGSTSTSGSGGGSSLPISPSAPVVPTHAAQYISMDVPVTMFPGWSYNVSVTLKNTGRVNWTAGTDFKLGSQSPRDNTIWGFGRVYLPPGVTVAPGQEYKFSFTVRAPQAEGIHEFAWKMVQEGVAWFGDVTPPLSIRVSGGNRSIPFASSSSLPDFDGDRFADFADFQPSSGEFWIHRNLRNGAFDSANWGYANAADSPWRVLAGDFTGDGKADYADFEPPTGYFWVHQNLGNGSFSPDNWTWANVGALSADEEVLVGDFNGDRYADIFKRNVATGALTIYLNPGRGGAVPFSPVSGCCSFKTMTGPNWKILVGDFNGDGLADIADYDSNMNAFWVHLNNGAPSYDFSKLDYGYYVGTQNPSIKLLVGDFTGDGRADVAEVYLPTGEFWVHANRGNGNFEGYGINWGYGKTYRHTPGWLLLGE